MDVENAWKYFNFYKARAKKDLLREGAIVFDPEFDLFKEIALTLMEDKITLLIDDYFGSRWLFPAKFFKPGQEVFPIHISQNAYWHLIKTTTGDSNIGKDGFMYLHDFEPMIEVVEKRIAEQGFLLSKTAEAAARESQSKAETEKDKLVQEAKQELMYAFEQLCYIRNKDPKEGAKEWLEWAKENIAKQYEKENVCMAQAAVELFESIGGGEEQGRFVLNGRIWVPIQGQGVVRKLKVMSGKATPDELFFNTLASLVKWVKRYNYNTLRIRTDGAMTRRDLLCYGLGTAASITPAGRLITIYKNATIAKDVLLKKYGPTPAQIRYDHAPVIYQILERGYVGPLAHQEYSEKEGWVFVKDIDVTEQNGTDVAYKLALEQDIQSRIFGHPGNHPLDDDPNSSFPPESDLLARLRREAIERNDFGLKDQRILVKMHEYGTGAEIPNAKENPELNEIKAVIARDSGLDVSNVVNSTPEAQRYYNGIYKSILNDERIGEHTTLGDIERIREEYMSKLEGYVRREFQQKIQRVCDGYIEAAKRRIKSGEWSLDKGSVNSKKIESHPDYTYLAVLKLFYYNLMLRGSKQTKEFFDANYPGYRQIASAAKIDLSKNYGEGFLGKIRTHKHGDWSAGLPFVIMMYLDCGYDPHEHFGYFEKTTFFKNRLLLDELISDEDLASMGELAALMLGLPRLYDIIFEGVKKDRSFAQGLKPRYEPYGYNTFDPEPLIKWLIEPLPNYMRAHAFLTPESLPEHFKSTILNKARLGYYSIDRVEYLPEDNDSNKVVKSSSSGEDKIDNYADSIINNNVAADKVTTLLKVDDRKNIEFNLHELGFDIAGGEEQAIRSFIMSPSKSREEILARQNMLKAIITENGFSISQLLSLRRRSYSMLETAQWLCQKADAVTAALREINYDERELLKKMRGRGSDSDSKVYSVLESLSFDTNSLNELMEELNKIDDPLMSSIIRKTQEAMGDFKPLTPKVILDIFREGNDKAVFELQSQLLSILKHLHATSSFVSFADYAKRHNLGKAGFDPSKPEYYEDSWNFTRKKEEQILNSILFDNLVTVIFVGSNMSGKTHFLVQDLFIQLLGQAFGYIPASQGNLRIYKKLIFIDRVSAEETHDLGAHGKDCERKWKEAVDIADSDTKVIVDEGFSATSHLDQACLLDGSTNLFANRRVRYMVATHNEGYILNQIKKPEVDVYCLKIEIEKGKVIYKYKLEKVENDLSLIDSRALEVARTLGVKERIISRAQKYIDGKERPIQRIRRKELPDVTPYSEAERDALKKQQADGFLAFLPRDNILLPDEWHTLCAKYEFRGDDSYCSVRSKEEKCVYEPVFKPFSDNSEFFIGGSFAAISEEKLIMRILLTGSSSDPKEILERQKMFRELILDDSSYKDGKLQIRELGNRILTYLYGISIHDPKYYATANLHILQEAYYEISNNYVYNLDNDDAEMFLEILDTILSISGTSADECGISEYIKNIRGIKNKKGNQPAFVNQINAIMVRLFDIESPWAMEIDRGYIQQFLMDKASKDFPEQKILKPVSCLDDAGIEKLKTALVRLNKIVSRMETKRGPTRANFSSFVNIVRRLDVLVNDDDAIGEFCGYLKRYDSAHMHQFANYFEALLRHVSNNVKNGREFFKMLASLPRKDLNFDDMPCSSFRPAAIYPEMQKLYAIFGLAKLIKDEGWAEVRFHKKFQLVVKKAWNPTIEKAKQTRNDSLFDLNELLRICSGSNKSGKSYYIRQIIWPMLGGQTTGFGPADEILMPVFKRIVYLDRVGRTFDRNLSAFGTEATNLSEFSDITHSDGMVFAAADEIGYTTSPKYQSALSYAASEDTVADGNVFVIASHNHDYIVRFMAKNGGHAKVYYFKTGIKPDGKPDFTYVIKEGHAPSYGIEIARMMGLEELIKMIDSVLLAERNRVQSALAEKLNIGRGAVAMALNAAA